MDVKKISKAIAGALVGAITGTGTAAVVIPADVATPWYGYVAVGAINALIGFIGVYFAPANTNKQV